MLTCMFIWEIGYAADIPQVNVKYQNQYELNGNLVVWVDSSQTATFDDVSAIARENFIPFKQLSLPLSHNYTYWAKVALKNMRSDTTHWMLNNPPTGFVTYFIQGERQDIQFQTGKYTPARLKPFTRNHQANAPLTLAPQETVTLYVKVHEIDHNPPLIDLNLYDRVYWNTLDLNPRKNIILFFQGIFWVMILYNLVLFFTVRFRAYLYYACYLLCIAIFVLYTVGPLQTPPWISYRYHQHLAFLAFGMINVFYFSFGRSFLDTQHLIPKWDIWIERYLIVKLLLLGITHLIIAISFNLVVALQLEFLSFFTDVILTLVLFARLLRTRSRLAYFFVGGSASVITIGLSLAVLGHIYGLKYTFVIFLSTIVLEIYFFSMGLGYRMRESERKKLEAEREKREAQEALNRELSKINTAFGRFVPHEFIQSLGHESVLDVSLGEGVEKEVIVMFIDIRSYTTLSEKMTPQENFHFLNEYLGHVGPIIQDYKGFVNQYYGDGIMALFPQEGSGAIEAAVTILHKVRKFNEDRSSKGEVPIRIGIGMHRGSLMMGIIGDTLRMEAGVVSDTVNTAARMEGLTKYYGVNVIVSGSCIHSEEIRTIPDIRYLGKVQVKGKHIPLDIYDAFGGDEELLKQKKAKTCSALEKGIALYYQRDFAAAAHRFDEVLEQLPEDITTRRFLENSKIHLLNGVTDDWTGVEMMTKK